MALHCLLRRQKPGRAFGLPSRQRQNYSVEYSSDGLLAGFIEFRIDPTRTNKQALYSKREANLVRNYLS